MWWKCFMLQERGLIRFVRSCLFTQVFSSNWLIITLNIVKGIEHYTFHAFWALYLGFRLSCESTFSEDKVHTRRLTRTFYHSLIAWFDLIAHNQITFTIWKNYSKSRLRSIDNLLWEGFVRGLVTNQWLFSVMCNFSIRQVVKLPWQNIVLSIKKSEDFSIVTFINTVIYSCASVESLIAYLWLFICGFFSGFWSSTQAFHFDIQKHA